MKLCVMLMAMVSFSFPAVRIESLKCEYRVNPLGIDVAKPRLSWMLASTDPKARGVKQSAYRIVVTSDEIELWDSGKVQSEESVHVVYGGRPLAAGERASWKVQVWDQDGKLSAWSQPAYWSKGIDDWKAKWIGKDEEKLYKNPASPFWLLEKARWIWSGGEKAEFTKTFDVAKPAKKAVVIMAADKQFELTFNGKRIGRGNGTTMPDVYDVTPLVRVGGNSVNVSATGVKQPGLIGVIRVEFEQGEPLVLVTDRNWSSDAKELGPYGMQPWGEIGFSEERALPARMLRKEFELSKPVKRAMAYVSGLGLFELHLNGSKVGDHVLSPNLTDYEKRVQYVTFDVTKQLAEGKNAVGVMLGNGRYWAPRDKVPIGMRSFGYPKLLVQIEAEFADGSKTMLASDESWKLTSQGPIRANNEFDGEEYDARMEPAGWSRAGFNDSAWEQARLVTAPAGEMVAQMAEPLRVVETIRPVKITEPRKGVWVYDMGQNMVGWSRLRVTGPKGTQVSLRHAETLGSDGMLYLDNLRSARATNYYTLKGGGPEVGEPRFTYHGYRFVEVRGFPGTPTLAAIEGRVVQDAMERAGEFSTSNALLNQIHKNIFWGVRGNYRSIPTDCPQRDERMGWLGDRSVVSRSESYLFDVAAFYSKWTRDIADAQRPNGSVPDVAPAYWTLYSDNITWPGTFLLAPDMLYEQYGERRVIERDYPAMKKWVEYMRGFLKDGLMPRDTYGDWCVPPESPELIHSQDPARKTDGTLIGTAYYYKMLLLMVKYARIVGVSADEAEYKDLAGRVKAAFHRRFFKPESGQYDNGTQTSAILPLAFGMAPEENRKTVLDGLIRKIETESKGHVGTGLVGAQWLMRTLTDNGRADIAYRIATQKEYPGWGYMISRGATTIWELWNGDTADPAMNSGNHVMQIGDLAVWMYERLAGIRSDAEKPGFKHVIVKPQPAGDLTFVKASHRSLYGLISSHWRKEAGRFLLDVTVPPNTTATVYVPAKEAGSVTEGGAPASKARGVKILRMEDGAAVFEVGSGSYTFASPVG